MREVTASAPAKVNLILRAGAPAPDGYHPLVTVFEALDLRDTVTARTARAPGIRVRTRVHRPDGSLDEELSRALDADPGRHLAVRAAHALQRLAAAGPWAQTAAGLVLEVDKRIPVAGGMAGGSADAAATLVACNDLWGLGLTAAQLEQIGRTLGADVPACLAGGLTLGTGRGDRLRLLRSGLPSVPTAAGASSSSMETGAPSGPALPSDEGAHAWILALSSEGLSTPAVFRELDAGGGPGRRWTDLAEPGDELLTRLAGPASALAGALVNDLEGPALRLRPDLRATMATARRAGAADVVLSGSGPTVAALARDAVQADSLAEAWRAELGAVAAGAPGDGAAPRVADVIVAGGPAQGARIEAESDSAGGRD